MNLYKWNIKGFLVKEKVAKVDGVVWSEKVKCSEQYFMRISLCLNLVKYSELLYEVVLI